MDKSIDSRKEKRALFDKAVFDWWKEMQPAAEQEGKPNRRGELAALRRGKTLTEILLVPRFQKLRWELNRIGYESEAKYPAIAAIAGILAHIKQTTDLKFPVWLAQYRDNGEPGISELRFRRLMSCHSLDQFFPALIRTLPLADQTAPVASLAHDIYYWGDKTRQDWTMAYYNTILEQEEKSGKAASSR